MNIEQELEKLRAENVGVRSDMQRLSEQTIAMEKVLEALNLEITSIAASLALVVQPKPSRVRNLEMFREKVQSLLKNANSTQAVLAGQLSWNANTLNARLNGRTGYEMSDAHAKLIVTELLKQSIIDTRAEADDLFDRLAMDSYTDREWSKLQKDLGPRLETIKDATRTSLASELVKSDKAGMLTLLEERRFTTSELGQFIRYESASLGLRMQCLDLLFSYSKDLSRDTNLIVHLQRSPFREIKIRALKSIAEHQLSVTSEVITEALKRASDMDVILNASRAARYSVVNQGMEPEILAHAKFVNHKEWGVKSNAVKGITERNPENAFDLLLPFKTTVTYFKTRDAIADYIEARYNSGTLQGRDLSISVEMLQSFISDGQSSEQRAKRLEVLLEKVSAWNAQE